MRFLRNLALSLCTLIPLALPNHLAAEGRSIIVLDASGSMWGQIDGTAKLEIARNALGTVLAGLPPDSELGLMAYGHRSKGDCNDIELVVPPGKGTAAAIIAAAREMKFLGKTPLTAAVRQAAAALRSTEEKATVILITDGIETCEGDPCALGLELEASGVDFTAHVVGFGLSKAEGQAVACLAQNTGGQYIEAKDAGQLEAALQTTVQAEPAPAPAPPAPAPEPAKLEENVKVTVVLAKGQPPNDMTDEAQILFYPVGADGVPSRSYLYSTARVAKSLPAGAYLLQVQVGESKVEQPISLSDTAMSDVTVVLDAGILRLRAIASEGAEPDNDARIDLKGPGDITEIGYATMSRVVPAGQYSLTASLGAASLTETLEVKPGDDISKDLVLGTGIGLLTAVYAGELKVNDNDLKLRILSAKPSIDGTQTEIAYNWGNEQSFDLPPGDYIARAELDAAAVDMPLNIKVKERSAVTLDLQAGVVAILAPHDERIDIVSPKQDIEGNQRVVIGSYGPNWQVVLPAADYIARITLDGAIVDTAFTVVAGERLELALAGATP